MYNGKKSSAGSTEATTDKTALAAYQLLKDATILAKLTPDIQQDKLKRITG